MLRLRLRSSGQVLAAIPRFNRFLEPYNLKIINQKADTGLGSVELLVSAHFFGERKLVTQFATHFFGSGILEISNDSGEGVC
jgi:hypothetical protein